MHSSRVELLSNDILELELIVGRELIVRFENNVIRSNVFEDLHGNTPPYFL